MCKERKDIRSLLVMKFLLNINLSYYYLTLVISLFIYTYKFSLYKPI